jgi:hypothetical protein
MNEDYFQVKCIIQDMFRKNSNLFFPQENIKTIDLEKIRLLINENMFLQFERYGLEPIVSIYDVRKFKEYEQTNKIQE